MFERGEVVVRISGGPPMTVVSVTADGRGRRIVLCEGREDTGRLTSVRVAEEDLALYFPPPTPRDPTRSI